MKCGIVVADAYHLGGDGLAQADRADALLLLIASTRGLRRCAGGLAPGWLQVFDADAPAGASADDRPRG